MARYEVTITVVNCAKLGRELPALERAPFPGKLGQRIYDEISEQAWGMWNEHSTLVINHYGLNMADPRAQDTIMKEMEEFFFSGNDPNMPDEWTPPGAGGKGAPSAKGAPQGK